ncbi:MAG: hypothetical protein HZA54_16060 [Planctomycetes bacterium]|nr:hypothetical protein [Planctomycetota bacterium]
MRRLLRVLVAAVLGVAAGTGCLERKESIVVAPDGSAVVQVRVKGDANDVESGDALPTAASGWQVEETSEADAEGRVTLTRTATRAVAAGGALPSSYAPADAAATALAFPTRLTVESGPAGTYYHFQRTYRGRTWRAVEQGKERLLETPAMKQLSGKDPSELTDEDRAAVVGVLIECGRHEASVYLHQAWADAGDAVPQAAFLAAHEAVLGVLAAPTLQAEALDLVTRSDWDGIVRLAQRLQAEQHAALERALRVAGVAAGAADGMVASYEFHRTAREISGDLMDENWEVSVTLPGRVTAHDSLAPAAEAQPAENQVVWRFDGKSLADRDVVLTATSFVPAGANAGK